MSSLTNYGERLALDITTAAVGGNTPAATRYVALYTVAPGEEGGGTELSGSGYVREQVIFTPASTDGGTGVTSTSNFAEVLFDAATGSWGEIVAMAIFDASTSGNIIWYGTLTTPKTVGTGDQFRFANGAIVLTMA
jgi:hypothetical protein